LLRGLNLQSLLEKTQLLLCYALLPRFVATYLTETLDESDTVVQVTHNVAWLIGDSIEEVALSGRPVTWLIRTRDEVWQVFL
jgi:hypothetical protein